MRRTPADLKDRSSSDDHAGCMELDKHSHALTSTTPSRRTVLRATGLTAAYGGPGALIAGILSTDPGAASWPFTSRDSPHLQDRVRTPIRGRLHAPPSPAAFFCDLPSMEPFLALTHLGAATGGGLIVCPLTGGGPTTCTGWGWQRQRRADLRSWSGAAITLPFRPGRGQPPLPPAVRDSPVHSVWRTFRRT